VLEEARGARAARERHVGGEHLVLRRLFGRPGPAVVGRFVSRGGGGGARAAAAGRLVLPARLAGHPREHAYALNELHGEEPDVFFGEQLVEVDEVGVAQLGERAELALQPVDGVGVDGGEGLERDVVAELFVPRAPHDAHAALTEPAAKLEALEAEWKRS